MTYMYYALLGTFITVFFGIVVSLIWPATEDEIYDENLLHPFILRMSKKFPGKPRKYLTRESIISTTLTKETKQKEGKEVDNLAFEMHDDTKHNVEIEVSKRNGSISKNRNADPGKHDEIQSVSRHFENYDKKTTAVKRNTLKAPHLQTFRNLTEEEINTGQVTKF